MRMILMQMAFGALSKAQKLTRARKVGFIVFICSVLMIRDLANFFKSRGNNIYGQIGLTRLSTIHEFDDAFKQYALCTEYDDECRDTSMKSPIYSLEASHVAEIKYVVTDPQLKELYDKTEIFIRKKTKSQHMPTEGAKYMQAFKELSSYAGFVFFMFILVEQHQHFAKQMVIGSLLIFATTSVQLRMPKEGGNPENAIIQLVDKIPFFNKLCYFEINYILKSVIYPGLFHMALHISRMIDVAPEIELKVKLLNTQRELTKSLLACEMVCNTRATEPVEEQKAEEVKEVETAGFQRKINYEKTSPEPSKEKEEEEEKNSQP